MLRSTFSSALSYRYVPVFAMTDGRPARVSSASSGSSNQGPDPVSQTQLWYPTSTPYQDIPRQNAPQAPGLPTEVLEHVFEYVLDDSTRKGTLFACSLVS